MIEKAWHACQIFTACITQIIGEVVDDDAPSYVEGAYLFAEAWSREKNEGDNVVEHDNERVG